MCTIERKCILTSSPSLLFYYFSSSHLFFHHLIPSPSSSLLETLSREDQNILRTASIIGRNFSSEILYGILSPKLRTQMFDSVLSLVKSQWIIEIEASRGVSSTEYSFVHPLFYHTLYNLTPAGDKAVLHSAVACYLEAAHRRSPLYYAQLGRHFGLARDCRPKALEYFVRASVYCLSSGMVNYDEGLELLAQVTLRTQHACSTMVI